jgi:hypothetical protein
MNRSTITPKEVNSEDTTHDNVDRSAISDTSPGCSETPEQVFGFTGMRTRHYPWHAPIKNCSLRCRRTGEHAGATLERGVPRRFVSISR